MARIVYLGTPQLAVSTLRALYDAGHDIVLVVSQADKRRGRNGALAPSPVKAAALELGLPVTDSMKDVVDVDADMGVLVAFGRVIRPEILEHIRIINLHPSLLPRWRGATPVEAAILAGDEISGICLMQLANEMDAGPIFSTYSTPIEAEETAAELYRRLFEKGNDMLLELLQKQLPEPVPQVGEATYCGKFSPDDFRIDWRKPAISVERLTRIGRPWTTFRSRRVLVTAATAIPDEAEMVRSIGSLHGVNVQTGDGVLRLKSVQPEGKAVMDAQSWTNGLRLGDEEIFE